MKDYRTFRNKTLIPPILYIYYTAIVMEISNKYVEKRNSNISVRYAGNYKRGSLHYRQEYYEFINELEENSILYDTFIKVDIKDFYENIDINKMTNLLKDSISMNEKEQNVQKIQFVITSTITKEKYNDRDCYLIKVDNSRTWVDKESGLVMRTMNGTWITERFYEFDVVKDEDIQKPDISDCRIREEN